MDIREKLNLLGEAARYDDCSASAPDVIAAGRGFFAPQPDAPPPDPRVLPCVSHLTTPWGERKATLKVLQTSACQNNCRYCAFRTGRDIRRAHLTPDELARSFDLMYRGVWWRACSSAPAWWARTGRWTRCWRPWSWSGPGTVSAATST